MQHNPADIKRQTIVNMVNFAQSSKRGIFANISTETRKRSNSTK